MSLFEAHAMSDARDDRDAALRQLAVYQARLAAVIALCDSLDMPAALLRRNVRAAATGDTT